MNPTILVVEDDLYLRNLMNLSFMGSGYNVCLAGNGREALEKLNIYSVDLVLLDVLMPDMDGYTVCVEIRKRSNVPVILVTGLNQSDDVVRGLKLGADDFVKKPFLFRELLARVEAVLRRRLPADRERAEANPSPIFLDPDSQAYEVRVHDRLVSLTKTEYELLKALVDQTGRAVSKTDLLQKVWGYGQDGDPNIVEVGILRLRRKIEQNPSSPVYLRTVRGVGYRFSVPSEETPREEGNDMSGGTTEGSASGRSLRPGRSATTARCGREPARGGHLGGAGSRG